MQSSGQIHGHGLGLSLVGASPWRGGRVSVSTRARVPARPSRFIQPAAADTAPATQVTTEMRAGAHSWQPSVPNQFQTSKAE